MYYTNKQYIFFKELQSMVIKSSQQQKGQQAADTVQL